jgi:hypothetical protein
MRGTSNIATLYKEISNRIMAKFQIPICRISYGFNTIEVEAESLEQAQELALEEAPNVEFSEKDAEYDLA